MHDEEWIQDNLAQRRAEHALRGLRPTPKPGGRYQNEAGQEILNFCSNDYLDLARHPRVVEAASHALQQYGAGTGSSRLVAGDLPLFGELEERLAAAKGYEACLLFGSGYMVNVGLLAALMGRHDRIYADKWVHACIIDGARLSGAELIRYQHNDTDHLRDLLAKDTGKAGRRLVATESIFSMDGDIAPLRDIVNVAEKSGAILLVDEAHATGALGSHGRGLVAELGLSSRVNLCVGTLSKALGSYGGFVCCSGAMRDFLINCARTFVYSTALPPAAAGAALGALDVLRDESDRPLRLAALSSTLRSELTALGWDILHSQTQIIPILTGENESTLEMAARLEHHGFRTAAIRPPTVPTGTARVRLSVTLAHGEADLRHLCAALGANKKRK